MYADSELRKTHPDLFPKKGWLNDIAVGDKLYAWYSRGHIGGASYALERVTVERLTKTKVIAVTDNRVVMEFRRGKGRSQWVDYSDEGKQIVSEHRTAFDLLPYTEQVRQWCQDQLDERDADEKHKNAAYKLADTRGNQWMDLPLEVLQAIVTLFDVREDEPGEITDEIDIRISRNLDGEWTVL